MLYIPPEYTVHISSGVTNTRQMYLMADYNKDIVKVYVQIQGNLVFCLMYLRNIVHCHIQLT